MGFASLMIFLVIAITKKMKVFKRIQRSSIFGNERPRVFQIGFNRCGTTSLVKFMRSNGYTAVHWSASRFSRGGTLAVGMELARREGKPLLTYLGRYDLYADMEKINLERGINRLLAPRVFKRLRRRIGANERVKPLYAYRYYKLLDEQYPGSRFILNIRDIDEWVDSRLRFNDRKYRSCPHGDEYHKSEEELIDCWKSCWQEHQQEVRAYFADRRNGLLIFDIQHDDPGQLVSFLPEFELNEEYWGRYNATSDVSSEGLIHSP